MREHVGHEPVDLGVSTRLRRTQETLDLALGGREVPRIVLPALDEIGFGAYEGGPLTAYREWAWSTEPDVLCPGGGESRAQVAERIAGALDVLLSRPEDVVLAVSHALPVRYVLDASEGTFPAAQIGRIPHATAFELDSEAVARAAETLHAWAAAPRFREPV